MPSASDSTRPDFSDLTARVYRLCLAMVADRADAEEAAQEALTRAWARRGVKRRDVSWWTFAAGFAVRVCHETRRRRLADPGCDSEPSRGLKPAAQEGDDGWQIGGALHLAIAELPRRQREVVVLRFLMSMSTEQTAEALAVPPGTVKSNLFKAMRNLRDVLGSNERIHELLGL